MDLNGFIKIDRKIQKWEWYDDLNMCGFFLHLLLLANWEDRRWHGIVIKRGSFVTSYRKLAESVKRSAPTICRWLKQLSETGEVTVETTPRYTVISIVSYDFYQSKNMQGETLNETLMKRKRNTDETLMKRRCYTTEEVKEYKENPDNYKGHVGDVSSVIRIALTTKSMTPNLYDIMKLFGKERIIKRIEELEKNI